jgi:hypothetical protein
MTPRQISGVADHTLGEPGVTASLPVPALLGVSRPVITITKDTETLLQAGGVLTTGARPP